LRREGYRNRVQNHGRGRADTGTKLKPSRERQLSDEATRQYGDGWNASAWQARVWSYILLEIPEQLYAYERSWRAPIEREIERLDPLSEYDNAHTEVERLRKLLRRVRIQCTLASPSNGAKALGSCTVASIHREVGIWPNCSEVRVEFALSCLGEVGMRCLGTPSDRPKLPAIVLLPRGENDARDTAASFVRAAIRLVAEEDLPGDLPRSA